jgi:hypothetical protein
MTEPAVTLPGLIGRCEADLIAAGALLERTPDADLESVLAGADLHLRAAYRAAEACHRWLLLYRPAQPAAYDPRDLPRMLSGSLNLATLRPRGADDAMLHGDLAQITCCLRVLAEGVALGQGGSLRAELRMDDDFPALLVRLDDAAPLSETLLIEGLLTLPWEAFAACWAGATGGGAARRAGSRVLLELAAEDAPAPAAEPSPASHAAWAAARRLAERLRPWRGATGHYESGLVGVGEVRALYTRAIGRALEDLRGLPPGSRR